MVGYNGLLSASSSSANHTKKLTAVSVHLTTGYNHRDETHIAHHLIHAFKVFSKEVQGRLNHAEFVAALSSVNTVFPAGQVSAVHDAA